MADTETYGLRVAARTRAAAEILRNPELTALYLDKGGLRTDLEQIRDLGLNAEALALAKNSAKAAGGTATLALMTDFAALQKEYAAVMAVVQAVRHDLVSDNAPVEVVREVDRILVNEAQLVLRPIPGTPPAVADGPAPKPKRRAATSTSQEAVRAEIQRDAVALLALKEAQTALARRKVSAARLKALRDSAQALTDKLGERASKKGESVAATTALREAVTAQRQAWSACYRILTAVAQEDQRVRQLLAEGARSR